VTWVPATVGFSGIEISRTDRRLMDSNFEIRRESSAKFKIKFKINLNARSERDTRTPFTMHRAVSTMAETWRFSTMGDVESPRIERENPRFKMKSCSFHDNRQCSTTDWLIDDDENKGSPKLNKPFVLCHIGYYEA
jgi:hypothetical protein